jgi:Ala-tRNA(Pro) deacylase
MEAHVLGAKMRGFDRLRNYLDEHKVPYETHEHPTAFTAQELAEAEDVPGRTVAKAVMALADGDLVMLVLPAPYQVNLDRVTALIGRPVRLAHEEEFTPAFPDCDAGAMPPFGNLYGVPVYVDRALGRAPRIVFQAGSHTHTMALAYADYERLADPILASFADPP